MSDGTNRLMRGKKIANWQFIHFEILKKARKSKTWEKSKMNGSSRKFVLRIILRTFCAHLSYQDLGDNKQDRLFCQDSQYQFGSFLPLFLWHLRLLSWPRIRPTCQEWKELRFSACLPLPMEAFVLPFLVLPQVKDTPVLPCVCKDRVVRDFGNIQKVTIRPAVLNTSDSFLSIEMATF